MRKMAEFQLIISDVEATPENGNSSLEIAVHSSLPLEEEVDKLPHDRSLALKVGMDVIEAVKILLVDYYAKIQTLNAVIPANES